MGLVGVIYEICLIVVAAASPPDVGFDRQRRVVCKAGAIDLIVLHYALNVIARLHERNALDPVDRIDTWIARVAEALDPFLHSPAAGIVGSKCKNQVAAII